MMISTMLRKAAGCSNLDWAILSLFLALALCQVSLAQGDNLWNIRENADDRFHDNEPWLRPWRYNYDDGVGQWIGYWSYEVPWGSVSTIGGSNGSFSIGRGRDHQFHVWTYARVETDQTISLYGNGDCVPRVFVNYSFDSPIGFTANHASLALNSGWNRIDITGYNQNDGYTFTCGALADLVDVMNSYEILNQPPVADAGPDQTLEQESYAGTEVTLDGSGSTDPDSAPGTNDDIIGFEWYEGATLLGIGETIKYTLPLGSHTVTLKVTDSFGETDEDEVIIVVVDTTPPTIICPADVTVEQESHAGTVVPLEATATDICDPDPDITSDELAIYPLGVTTVTFTATDASGNIASRSMTVTVVDTTPPDVACSTDPDKLWPRNNQMVSVDIFVEASDICTETSDLYLLVEVTSSDPDDTKNGEEKFMGDVDGDDGYTAPVDVTDTFDPVVGGFLGSVELRAECVGKNNRVYVVTATIIDFSGNLTTTNCEVLVEARVHGRP